MAIITNSNLLTEETKEDVETLGEHLDRRIASLREQLEALCITKAKAEAMQMLNVPMDFMNNCTW